jgi:DnaK suppressor protein
VGKDLVSKKRANFGLPRGNPARELLRESGSLASACAHLPKRKTATMKRANAILALRQILLKRRNALRQSVQNELTDLCRIRASRAVGDWGDEAFDCCGDELNSQLAQAESRELQAIEDALERMREGTYGLCEDCDGQIPLARLQAVPYATRCVKCQSASESCHGRLFDFRPTPTALRPYLQTAAAKRPGYGDAAFPLRL